MDAIEAGVRSILFECFSVDGAVLQADNRLVEDLGMDSLEIVQFALDLEETFDIEVPDSSITAEMTVGDVCEAVKILQKV